MDNTQEKYFDSLREMFLTEGWKNLLDGLKNDIVNLNNISNISNESELSYRKGQLNILSGIYNLEETVKAQETEGEDIYDESLD